MEITKIDTRISKLGALLEIASRKGFKNVVVYQNDLGRPYSIGFEDNDGQDHTVHVNPDDDLWPFLTGRRYR